MTNKKFWRTDKPFSTNNGCISNNFIGIENYGNVISNEKEEKVSAKKTLSLRNSPDASQDEMIVKEIISVYSNHPSIREIKNFCVPENKFDLPLMTLITATAYTHEIIKALHINKNKGPDGISAAKVLASVINCHLPNIINDNIFSNIYSKHAKIETLRPFFKKNDRTKIKNYRLVNLFNIFLKICEGFLHGISFKICFRCS